VLQSADGKPLNAHRCNMASTCSEQWNVYTLDVKQLWGRGLEGCTEQQLELGDRCGNRMRANAPAGVGNLAATTVSLPG
jgi:hypothetical protein